MNKLFAKIMLAIIVVMMLLTLLPVASVRAQTNDTEPNASEISGERT